MNRLVPRIATFSSSLLVCASALACASSDAGADPSGNAAGGSGGDAGTAAIECLDDGAIDLTGTWAAIARFTLRLQSQTGGVVTVCPEGQAAQADLLLLVQVKPGSSPDAPELTAWPCSLALPTVSAIAGKCEPGAANLLATEIRFPAPLVTAFPTIPVQTVQGALQGNSANAALSFPRLGFTWGTRNALEEMPRWLDDQSGCGLGDFDVGRSQTCESACIDDCGALVDDDGDGYPAVTLHVCGRLPDDVSSSVACHAETPTDPGVTLQGLLPMVLHTELELAGTARSSCEAVAQFDSKTVYSVVGADAYLANTRVSVASALKSLPLFDAVKSESSFRMIRVDGEFGAPDWAMNVGSPAAACEVVRQRQNELQ